MIRSSYLDDARENGTRQAVSRGLLLTSGGGSVSGQVTGTLVRFVDLDVGVAVTTTAERAEVIVHGETVWIPADPGAYVLGGPVVVMVDGTGRPVRVSGPAGTVPSVPEGQPSPVVVHRPDLVIDAESRAASTAAGQAAAQAQADAEAAQTWINQTGETLTGRLSGAESGLSSLSDLLDAVRANTGLRAWQWVPGAEPFTVDEYTLGVPFLRVEALGGGRFRLRALMDGPIVGWEAPSVLGLDGGSIELDLPVGTTWVRYFDGGGFYRQAPVTVTSAMVAASVGEWVDVEMPDVDWSQAQIALDQLTQPGGPLDPAVLAALYEDVVVAGISVATEAFIGGDAILENSVQARHVVASESLWAKLAAFVKVTADMLYVGGMNLLPDPHFQDAALSEARRVRSGATASGTGFTNTSYFYWVPSTAAADVRRYAIPVAPGEQYRVEIPVTLSSALSTTPRFETWNSNGAGRVLRTGTDWTYEGGVLAYTVTIPSGVSYMSPVLYRTTSYTLSPGTRVVSMVDSRVIVDGAVTARAMNVVTTASGATLRIDPDGIRLWRAGNPPATGSPNVTLTAGDGFRVQRDDGTGLMWIDPATGDLHTAGNVISGGTINGAAFSGGSISIVGGKGEPIFSASQSGGVQIGGARNIYTRTTTVTSTNQLLTMSSTVSVDPGRTYRCRFLVTRSAGWEPEMGRVQAAWDTGVVGITPTYLPPVTGTGTPIEVDIVAPAGATTLYLRWVTTDPVPAGQNIRTSLVSIGEVSDSDVQVSGEVSAPVGRFSTLRAGEIQGMSGVPWDPTDTGWLPFDLTANWVAVPGSTPQRRKRGDMVYLRGEVTVVNPSGSMTLTTLPSGWRPASRKRVPWGWGAAAGWVMADTTGAITTDGGRTSPSGYDLSALDPLFII